MDKNEELLKTIRQRFKYGIEKWRKNREDGQKNMRYVAGDPWDQEDKDARKGRPTVCADELNQYVNQVVNTARQNPRGIKVDPAGDQATEELAEYRENRIRAIEYACNATQVYINGLQAAVERNMGFWKVSRVYVSDDSEEQEIVLVPVMNPDTVVIDPDYKELDGADIKWAFELDRIPLDEFKTEYPNASIKGFKAEDFGEDSNYWIDDDSVQIASYWVVETKTTKRGNRVVKSKSVKQYVTNGIEILEEGDTQPGPYIPIIPVFGKEIWVSFNDGGNAERVLLSLVSLARDPQKALAFVMSAMLENMGQLPKTPFIGMVGQFETDSEAWRTVNNVFHPYLQVDPVTDEGGNAAAFPQRQQLTPDFGAYSTGIDVCRRAIMSAMGLQALPTAAQRQNQKSGVALDKIESQQSIGSYHLVDNYDRAIKLTGRIINCWLTETDLGETQRAVREADGSHKLVKINTDEPVMVDNHQYHFPIADDKGRYQVTISDGPSHESQREEASEFVDTIVTNIKNLPIPPQAAVKILALGIRMKQLGPMGDQMADIIDPPDNSQQQLGQLHQQMQQQGQQMQAMQDTLQKLMLERQGKVIEMQAKTDQIKMQEATKLAVAEITASKDANESMAERENETYQLMQQNAHEVALQAHSQANQQMMAQQAQAAQAQQAQAAQVSQQGAAQPQGAPNA